MTRLLEGVALFDEAKVIRDRRGRFAHKLGGNVVPGGVATGFYFPSDDRRHAGHTLTQQIRTSKVSRKHDDEFARRIARAAREHFGQERVDLVVTPPPKPGEPDRLLNVRRKVAAKLDASAAAPAVQSRTVSGYRGMTVEQRRKAGAHRYEIDASKVRGKSILLTDDVVTSGTTANELIRALKAAGASRVRFVAVSQATSAPEDRKDPRDGRVVEAALTHEPTGKPGGPGLWKHKGWQLPAYIQHVFNDLVESGHPKAGPTYRLAVGIVQNWAEGHNGKGGKVSAETQAKAAKAIAEWEAKKAATKGGKLRESATDLGTPPKVTDDELLEMAERAEDRLATLERLSLPNTGDGAQFDLALVEAAVRIIESPLGGRPRTPARVGRRSSGLPLVAAARAERQRRGAAKQAGPSNANFESQHPRGFGGKFVAKGSSGREVRAVQRRVGSRVDGEFGDKTAAAVRAYQRKHGLVVDGIVGRQTVAALRGRKDAKRVKIGALTAGDRTFLAGHVKGKGGKRRQPAPA